MKTLTLEQFLEQEEQAGALESTGEFSISLKDAMAKMVEHQFSDPIFFVLKLLQSAAIVGARDLCIRTSGKTSAYGIADFELFFKVDQPGRYGELASILKGLSEVHHQADANGHLAAGLQAAVPFLDHGFVWSHLRGIRKETIAWSPQGWEVLRQFNAHADPQVSEFFFRQVSPIEKMSFLTKFFGYLMAPKPGLIDYDKLKPRMATLPLDVLVHDRRLQRLGAEGPPQVLQLAPRKVFDVGFRVQLAPESQIILDPKGQATESPAKEHLRCSHYLRASSEGTGCRIHWIADGVVIDTEEIPRENVDFEAWVTTTDLQTDISGFGLVKNEAHTERVRYVRELTDRHLGPLYSAWIEEQTGSFSDSDLI